MTATTLKGLRDDNLIQLKRLNDAIYLNQFDDRYYSDAVESRAFSKLAYYCEECVGSITCHIEMDLNAVPCANIMTMGVLASYRRLGVGKFSASSSKLIKKYNAGTTLLTHVLNLCTQYNFRLAYLYVRRDDECALNFFQKFGFIITDTIENYYLNSTPDSHVLMAKHFDRQAKN